MQSSKSADRSRSEPGSEGLNMSCVCQGHPEAETESEFIYPVLNHLGWEQLPQQEPGKGRKDIADALLFLSAEDKAKARRLHQTADRFRLGVIVVENEARDTPLDRASGKGEAPSSQLRRYLIRAQT